MAPFRLRRPFRLSLPLLFGPLVLVALTAAGPAAAGESVASRFPILFGDPSYGPLEIGALVLSLLAAVGSLTYAGWLAKLVYASPQGTPRMQEIARAVREGSDAYLRRQLTVVGLMIVVITGVLVAAKWPWGVPADSAHHADEVQLAVGRGIAFLLGSLFSATVGFVGMRVATAGNLRVAAAARRNFGEALQLGYRSGTITGMLTDGLGLLGGVLIILWFGARSYDALLGYGFGGTLLALFMRVGGGIYTKAADVGADLVGKIEKDIPEDDPRNAATIADNVGDNVGDCAGMAADVFESYQVTFVAALILGYAAFGPKGVIFPLLVRTVGIVASIISTYLVRTGPTGNATTGMAAMNRGFRIGAGLSAAGILIVGFGYLWFDGPYVVRQAIDRGLGQTAEVKAALVDAGVPAAAFDEKDSAAVPSAVAALTAEEQALVARNLAADPKVLTAARGLVPLPIGFDWRPVAACLVGLILALALNFCTEYWTSTDYAPVRGLAKACRTGHATNIIEGIAVGYESAVWASLLIVAAILGAVLIYSDSSSPLFIAFGVAMCGLGMLTLTGATISMDVFGPVADNANGIGEMGFNRDSSNRELTEGDPDFIPAAEYKSARQILTDLDAVGNTTKAITKGIAIGSAVLAAVSLFASFVAVLATGSEEGINHLSTAEFNLKASQLNVVSPIVFVGMLLGGAVPFLFSSMTIRAVGRAAYLIVNECRRQFQDQEIWAGTKRPDYGRVVDICTATAQKELVGPGLLAIFTPVLVGFLLGPYALGGFLAGTILTGQLLAVFMSNAGGAWDNAKKMIEDQPRTATTGKGSETHKASVTGDTVGDPLKDTAGPAINPLIKVMNMVSLLVLPLVITSNVSTGTGTLGWVLLVVALAAVAGAWWQSKQESAEMRQLDAEYEKASAAAGANNGTVAGAAEGRTPAAMH
jgi:K(+)-stimulated pyrophosphate-energized sodium pump